MNGLGNSRNVNLAMRRRSVPAGVVHMPPAGLAKEISDLAVHLDGSPQDESRVAFAEMLALTFGARVEACLTDCFTLVPLSGEMVGGWLEQPYGDGDLSPGGTEELRLRARITRIDTPTTFRRFDGMKFELAQSLAGRARTVDLFVLGRPYGAGAEEPQFVEAVLFNAAAAVLVVPPELPRLLKLQSIVIAWKDTLECSRAIAASLPFLKQASRVFLVSVSNGTDGGLDWASAADMAAHLSHHGIAVEVRSMPKSKDTAELLLDEANYAEADLLVAGAYGRSRLSEMILGGVTRHLLTHSTVPLLLSH